jgi:type IV secretory pathway VirB10-like protein
MSSVIIVLFASLFISAIEPAEPTKPAEPAKRPYIGHHNNAAEEADAEIKVMKTQAELQKEQETRDRLHEMEEKDRLKSEQLAAERKKANLEAAAKAANLAAKVKDPNNIKNTILIKKIADLDARVKLLEGRIQRLENIHPGNKPSTAPDAGKSSLPEPPPGK